LSIIAGAGLWWLSSKGAPKIAEPEPQTVGEEVLEKV